MKTWIASLCVALIFSLALVADSVSQRADQQVSAKHDAAHTAQPTNDRGERVFMVNCARCHTPPMTLPPRITGTVVMHMRVRERLSRSDEQSLLKYLAP
jgi:cytochrome c5